MYYEAVNPGTTHSARCDGVRASDDWRGSLFGPHLRAALAMSTALYRSACCVRQSPVRGPFIALSSLRPSGLCTFDMALQYPWSTLRR